MFADKLHKLLARYKSLSTFAFSDASAQSPTICALCAKFQIEAVPEDFEDGIGYCFHLARHSLHQEYRDEFPRFPYMHRRAIDGCIFCNFLRTSLLSEYRKRYPGSSYKNDAKRVQVTLTTYLVERVDDKSALSAYMNQEPHTIKVRVHGKDYDEEDVEYLVYDVAFQISSGTWEAAMQVEKNSTDYNQQLRLRIEILSQPPTLGISPNGCMNAMKNIPCAVLP